MSRLLRFAILLPLLFSALALAVPPDAEKDKAKKKKATSDAEAAAKAAVVEGGLNVSVWASEPMLANPVAFAFDEQGRCFIAETNRMHDGVLDTRGFMHMLDDDIGSRSIADRLKKYQTHKYPDYSKFSENLRIVWDSTGSGHADQSEMFATGFNKTEDGLAAGVLARKGTVYFTCIPDVYAFKTKPDSPKPISKTSLSTGYGIRDQFVGHDLHGLRMGPDGKLYFSIGDRGLNVVSKEGKRLFNPDSGAVLRSNPDGSNLEIVHVGLRNPQELAFDNFGNLFTYDNNSDSGDQARWVQIVEGGDSGWRCGYQYGTLMHTPSVSQGNRGPWNTEKIWHVPGPDGGPPAYVVPPLKHFGNGPSGITHYPGLGLDDKYQNHFFACDFTSSPNNSKIWTLAVKPKGASFEVVDLHPFVQNMVPTDCEFGPDGAFYWLDWIGGWNKPQAGRIFKVTDVKAMQNPAVLEAQKLIAEGLSGKSIDELVTLLGHAHQTVRLESQYELAARTDKKKDVAFKLASLASNNQKPLLPRLHAIWGLGMIEEGGKNSTLLLQSAKTLFKDKDTILRAQAAKVLGHYAGAWSTLRSQLLTEKEPAVTAELVRGLGNLDPKNSPERLALQEGLAGKALPVFTVLKANNDTDAYVRQAAVQSLVSMIGDANPCDLIAAFQANSKAVDSPATRLGLVLALRKLHCRKLGDFLEDSDPKVVAEAARAINDQELFAPMEDLARLLGKPAQQEVVVFRAMNANFKLGLDLHAKRLAQFAASSSEPDHLRITALKLLADWAKPSRRDAITGLTQNLPERSKQVAIDAIKPLLGKLFVGSDNVRKTAVQTVTKLGISEVGPLMAEIVADSKQTANTRVEALFALEELKSKETAESMKLALASPEAKLRAAGRVVAAKANPTAAAKELPMLVADEKASLIEKQLALGVMGSLKESKEVDASLASLLDAMIEGKAPVQLKLDVLEAAEARATARRLTLHAPLREKLKEYDTKVRAKANGNMALRFPEAMGGGDAEKGKAIFINNAAVYCVRCHKVDNNGGEVGPALDSIGLLKDRAYLIESLVNPTAQIAQGFQSVILNTIDGKTVSGVLRSKDAKQYVLVTAENKVLTVPTGDVESEKPDKSAMPEDLYKKLSKREIRDLMEYLSTLKKPVPATTK